MTKASLFEEKRESKDAEEQEEEAEKVRLLFPFSITENRTRIGLIWCPRRGIAGGQDPHSRTRKEF